MTLNLAEKSVTKSRPSVPYGADFFSILLKLIHSVCYSKIVAAAFAALSAADIRTTFVCSALGYSRARF